MGHNPKVIVLISGKRKCGKDFLADKLRSELTEGGVSAVIVRISGPLKKEYARLHGLNVDRLMDSGPYKEEYRKDMVRWSDQIRHNDPFYFCRIAATEAVNSFHSDVFIVSDIRRPADVRYFLENFAEKLGVVVLKIRVTASDATRVKRGWKFEPGIDDAETECALDDAGVAWDMVVENEESNYFAGQENRFHSSFSTLIGRIRSVLTGGRYFNFDSVPIQWGRVTMSNPFDDDIDDEALKNPAYKPKSTRGGYTNLSSQAEDDELNFYERQIESIMQDSLASTGRSVRALEESEQIGVSTAENLMAQGEQLRKAEQNLDHIQNTTGQTQKHLNNIKSIFGGVKNYFSKSSSTKLTSSPSNDDFKSKTKLVGTMDGLQNDTSSYNKGGASSQGSMGAGSSLPESSKQMLAGTRWGAMDDQIDENLDMMAANLSRLKNLGMGLADEIDDQNKLIERIQVKAEREDIVIRDQDKQMKKIMGIKKPSTAATEAKSSTK